MIHMENQPLTSVLLALAAINKIVTRCRVTLR